MDVSSLLQRFASAKAKRSVWESHWQECYDYALPHGGGFGRGCYRALNNPHLRALKIPHPFF